MTRDHLGVQSSCIPDWMQKNDMPEILSESSMNTGFIRKTLNEISKIIQNDLISERYASKMGFLQSIDPRVKLTSLLLLVIISGMAKSFFSLILLAALGFVLARLSNIQTGMFLKRVWLVLPVLMFIISLPAATNLLVQGKPVFFLTDNYFVSLEGILTITKLSLRIGISFSFGYLLMMTTRWSQTTKALEMLKVPGLIISVLDMTYRYLFVLVRITVEMFEARYLRMVGTVNTNANRKFISESIAFLFIKAKAMSDEVYDSMVCRGYTGDTVSIKQFRMKKFDWVWIFNVIMISILLFIGEMIFG
jgi:cobalt ECF transporter T component CbiQ